MAQAVEDALVVRMEASLAKFERQMARASKSAETTSVGMERRFKAANDNIRRSSEQAGIGLARLSNISGRGRFVLQNTANQIGDIAVQMQSGTAASRAFGQQMPQLLGGFGVLGGSLGVIAPLMGTVAALGLPMAIAFAMAGREAQSLDDRMKSLKSSIEELNRAQAQTEVSAVDLVADYKSLADEAKAIFEINRQMAALRAGEAFDAAARGLAGELSVGGAFDLDPQQLADIDFAIAALQEEKRAFDTAAHNLSDEAFAAANRRVEEITQNISTLNDVRDGLEGLAEMFGITEEQAQRVVAQFAEIGNAGGPKEQAEAMAELAQYIKSASGNLVDATDEGRSLYDQLLKVVLESLRLAKVDFAAPKDGLAAAADEAGRLADNLLNALNRQNALAAGYNTSSPDENGNVYGGRGRGPTQIERFHMRYGYIEPPSPVGKSSGGGGKGPADGLREAQQLWTSTRSAAEEYQSELERINALHREFPDIVTSEVRDRAIAALDESTSKLSDTARTLEQSLENMFVSILSGATSAREAVSQLLGELSRLFLRSAFKSLDLGGSIGSILGFANGTAHAPGGLAVVGERGPELVNLPRGSQVIPNHELRGVGGGSNFTFAPVIDARGADQAAVVRLERGLAQLHAEFGSRVQQTLRQGRNRRHNLSWQG